MKQTKVQELKAKVRRLSQRISKLQNDCKHPSRSRIIIHTGANGNAYWKEITCKKCDKFWTEDYD